LRLVLAFDTATHVATVAVLRDGEVVGERVTRSHRVLADADEILQSADAVPGDIDALVVGTGPGSFTGLRLGLASARGFALARDVPVAGVSTLAALAAGSPGAVPVIDGGRREVFSLVDGDPRAVHADELVLEPGTTCVGDGALRYRSALESLGAHVPPDDSEVHIPHARLHALLARRYDPADLVEPIYVRAPDAQVRI
jgi:tRNA threonylcarbamoyladenosine biosynthesis protein TsaB